MAAKKLPDGRYVWEPYAAAAAYLLMVVGVTIIATFLLLAGCTLQGSNGFLPY